MIDQTREKKLSLLLCFSFLFFYAALASQIPYTHDDWDWGLPVGIEQLLSANLNSRYAGNLTVVLLTRSPLLKTLVMGIVLTMIPIFVLRVALLFSDGSRRCLPLLAANLLLLTMPREIWQQTCGWVSGFSNFVLSGLLLAGWHLLLLRPRTRKESPAALAGLFVYGAVMQLFLENAAIYAVLISLGFTLRGLLRRRPDRTATALLLGNLVGLAIVFSSNVYTVLFRDGIALDGTRELSVEPGESLPGKLLRCTKYYVKYFPSIWNHNVTLCCAILLLLTLGFRGRRRLVLGGLNACFALYFVLTRLFGELRLGSEKLTVYCALSLGFLYFCLCALEVFLLYRKNPPLCAALLLLWCSAPLVIAPLAVTNMDGGRLFFTPYLFETEFAALLLSSLRPDWDARGLRAAAALLTAAALALCLRWGAVYRAIGETARTREALLTGGEARIVLPEYPYGDYLWNPDPESPARVRFFREFYGVPDGTELLFESGAPFKDWP